MLASVARRGLINNAPSSIASCSYSTSSANVYEVVLSRLPSTVTHSDVRNICFKGDIGKMTSQGANYERIAKEEAGEMSIEDNKELTGRRTQDADRLNISRNMIDIKFQRSAFLGHNGKALVTFRTEKSAYEFRRLASSSVVGGSTITAILHQVAKGEPTNLPHSVKMLREAQKQSPGRVVLLKGLPYHLEADRLLRIIRPTYPLADDFEQIRRERSKNQEHSLLPVIKIRHVTPVESTSSFLVRFRTVSDALRFVRRWHKSSWDNSSGLTRLTTEKENEKKKRQDSKGLNEQYKDDFEHENEDSAETQESKVEKLWKIPLIIDAILMY
ncbi:hypothetical protein L7F22_019297 [Adiantum nelumboides]|nr:hypothetical protein [Adiantum nelumboides]